MRSIRRVCGDGNTKLSQLVQRTRLEASCQSRVVVVVDEAYSPVTGNLARGLRDSMPRDNIGLRILLLRIAVPPLAVDDTGASESPPVLVDVSPPLGGDAPPD